MPCHPPFCFYLLVKKSKINGDKYARLFRWFCSLFPEVGIPQFEAQSASCATSARAEVAKRFNKLFLAIAQVALRFKENKSFLRFIALRTEKIYNSVRIIALRTEKNLVACALSEVEILRCALSD